MPLVGFGSLCSERQKIIVSQDRENPQKHVAKNIRQCAVTQYKIDGVVITGEKQRCDFLLLNEDTLTAYLIELKGSDIEKAITQIDSTEKLLGKQLSVYSNRQYRIICNKARTQQVKGTKYRQFKAKNGTHFVCKTEKYEEEI